MGANHTAARHGPGQHVIEIVLIYLLLGSAAGLLAGLLGVGGGIVLVPGLLLVFAVQGIDSPATVHTAIATSLACIVFTALSATRAHHKRGAVDWAIVLRMTPGLMLGAGLGSLLADALSGVVLQRVFGALAMLVALRLLLPTSNPHGRFDLPGAPGLVGAGGLIGAISSLMGIGGGSLTVPFLAACRVVMVRAVGTSSACGLPLALAGTVGYALTGLDAPETLPGSAGYVLLPAAACIVVASMSCAPLGARLAHRLPATGLKRCFGLVLFVVSLRLMLGPV